ncbi:MAG: hypothetical protein LBS30_06585 [Planctomycetota bacterium]|jgi:rod shape-determining protein MreD|nr:hypothetical protein [Planctomycetota bacterium]
MFDQEIRWPTLFALAVLVSLMQIGLETGGVWFGFPARPDWVWCVAFYAVLRAAPVSALIAFASCGIVRDLFLGPRLGSAAIAYIVVGWLALSWRSFASERVFLTTTLLAGTTAFLAALLRHALDYGPLAYTLIDRVFFVAVGDGLLTGAAYPFLAVLLSLRAFRPCQERLG